jgi:hypothetical protein
MKVSYSEGVATHTDSESCIFVRKGAGEALTGVRAGQVWSREIEPPSRKRWTKKIESNVMLTFALLGVSLLTDSLANSYTRR